MTRNQIDAVVAAKVGCTASYVQQVRLYPDRYKSEKASRIKELLDEINSKQKRFLSDILQPA